VKVAAHLVVMAALLAGNALLGIISFFTGGMCAYGGCTSYPWAYLITLDALASSVYAVRAVYRRDTRGLAIAVAMSLVGAFGLAVGGALA